MSLHVCMTTKIFVNFLFQNVRTTERNKCCVTSTHARTYWHMRDREMERETETKTARGLCSYKENSG